MVEELLVQYGGWLGAIVFLIVGLRRSKNDTINALTKALDVSLSSMRAVQSRIDTLETGKVEDNQKRIEQDNTIDALRDTVKDNRREAEDVSRLQSAELVKAKADYASAMTRLGLAERAIERQQVEIDNAQSEIASLKLQLIKSEKLRIEVEKERDVLARRIGKLEQVEDDETSGPPTTSTGKLNDIIA